MEQTFKPHTTVVDALKSLGKLTFVSMGTNSIKASRGNAGVIITYNEVADLFDMESYYIGVNYDCALRPFATGVYSNDLAMATRRALSMERANYSTSKVTA